ncbi:MAG: antibiotic biosynthesis monooxygenase [Candidatus Baltobacteraceae bacterium]
MSLRVHEGKAGALEPIAREMAARTSHEDGALAYEFHISGDKRRCKLFEEYRDPAAAVAHLSGPVVGELVPALLTLADLESFEVFGDAGPDVMAIVHGFGASAYDFWHGLSEPG